MNKNHSNYTGRMHRTLESAFGPYAGRNVYERIEPMDRSDRIVVWASAVSLVSFLFILFIWG
jgi:hypothetical protein